jgi:hypothetical protein
MATLSALALMLDHLGRSRSAQRVEQAIEQAFRSGRVPSANTRSPVGTSQATDAVIDAIEKNVADGPGLTVGSGARGKGPPGRWPIARAAVRERQRDEINREVPPCPSST